jgi:FkbM family methyltransferase
MNLSKSGSVSVYGSGTFSRLVIEKCLKVGINVIGIYDHVNIGQSLSVSSHDFIVKDFNEIQFISDPSITILGICNLHGNLGLIADSIKELSPNMTLLTPVEFCNFLESIGERTIRNYWLHEKSEYYESHRDQIDKFRELLEDNESIQLYDSILTYRTKGRLENLPQPMNLWEQYLPEDLATPPKNLRMVDLGACQGENLEYFIKSGRTFELCIMLEPDEENLQILRTRVRSLGLKDLIILQLAAWSSTEILNFDFTANGSSSISDQNNGMVFGIILDDLLKMTPINYIKMDIEGAELAALKGSEKIIKRDLPHLAISVYHKPSDLWEIGLYLSLTYESKYKFFIRNYGHQTFDTVLYAIPVI